MNTFDPNRAWLKGPDYFKRFVVEGPGVPLSQADLKPEAELIIAERNGEQAAFLMAELSHPHGAQGELGGEPFLVSF